MKQEVFVFMGCVFAGGMIGLAFDFLNAMRQEISHRNWCITLEDLLFWTAAGFFLFGLLEKWNYGILRLYAFLGNGIGFLVYKKTAGKLCCFIFCLIFRQIGRMGRLSLKIGVNCGKILKKLIYYPLKSAAKKFKMILYNI